MKVFQIGAAGGIGRRLAALLSARGDEVTGMHRVASQAQTVIAAGAVPLAGDLIADDLGTLAGWMRGHDAVVFSAGAHGTGRDKTVAIDGEGLVKAVAAATRRGLPVRARARFPRGRPRWGRQRGLRALSAGEEDSRCASGEHWARLVDRTSRHAR